MRFEWTGLLTVALVATGCASSKVGPLLPMTDAGPAFMAANCQVPVHVSRRSVGHGDSAHLLVTHDCEDNREGDGLRIQMRIVYDEATKQVFVLSAATGANAPIDVDTPFARLYSGLIEPFLEPSRREAIRKFATTGSTTDGMDDTAEPLLRVSRTVEESPPRLRYLSVLGVESSP